MESCLFCASQFDPKTNKPEHVLLNAFGGKVTVSNLICSDCNGRLGGEIDRPLAEGFEFLRNMFSLKKGDGQCPPTIVDRSDDGRQIRLKPGLVVNSRTADPVSRYFYDKEGNRHIEIKAHENAIPSMKSKLAEEIASKEGRSKEEILASMEDVEVIQTSEQEYIEKTMSFNSGGVEGMRSLMMSSILLFARQNLATRLFAASPVMEHARKFVSDGSEKQDLWWYDHHIPPQITQLSELFGPLFNLFVVFNHPRRGLMAYIRTYNIGAMRLQLSDKKFPRLHEHVHLVSNPIDGTWSENVDGIDDLVDWVIANGPKPPGEDKTAIRHMDHMIMEANQITDSNVQINRKTV